jgi:hypothetical protein
MLDNIIYLALFALVIYALAVIATPKNDFLQLFDNQGNDEGKDEVTDADFPQCEGGSECKCKTK